MKHILFTVLILLFSCASVNTEKRIENYRIVSFKYGNEDYFIFKSPMTPAQAKYSLRKQFLLNNNENLSSFQKQLFKNLDLKFEVKVSFDTNIDKYRKQLPVFCQPTSDGLGESSKTFIKIIVKDEDGNNCLSNNSLFYNKIKMLLIDIKNNIKKEDYFNPTI